MNKISDDIIWRYLQGTATTEDMKALNEYISASPENKKYLFSIEELYHLGKWKYDEEEKINAAMQRLKLVVQPVEMSVVSEKKEKKQMKHLFLWTRYAAAVLVLVLIGWLSFRGLTSEDMIKVYADNKIRKIELADGTKVWLNKGSVFEYPKTFTKDNRKVRLDGEAYFQVARQTGKHKFTVESKLMTVVVHGTIFNMKSYARDTVAETSLIEGEVLVESANDDSKIVLLPGQKAIVEKNNHKMVVKETNSIMDGIWRNNMVPFQNATIQDIAKVLEDLYHVKIEVRKDIDLEHTYSGMIEKKQELEDVIKTLQNSIPIKYKIESDKVLIEPVE